MSHADNIHTGEEGLAEQEELRREARLRRRNRILLAALVLLALALLLAAHPLFNNYWDPTESEKTISH